MEGFVTKEELLTFFIQEEFSEIKSQIHGEIESRMFTEQLVIPDLIYFVNSNQEHVCTRLFDIKRGVAKWNG
ncbi:hypothetical protein [Listeria fleischmannii]|uniref:Uncharacterized protein n=1 Tax=Listeria fleischmannii FSL S10-1203 TaxID=1265822 RepID=W7DCM5_9LIST|nr:hypothetical protein [Listeria fleischmannii]EUJ47037.1 hypothetical protein MCOL2_18589 [Listeria fleischmannii FSL S10-1203]